MAVWALVTGSFPPFANVYFVHHLGLSLEKMGFVFSLRRWSSFCCPLRSSPVSAHGAGQRRDSDPIRNGCRIRLSGLDPSRHGGGMGVPDYMAVQYMNEPGIFSLLMDQIPPSERSSASASTFFVTYACQAMASAMGAAIVRFGYPRCYLVLRGWQWWQRGCSEGCQARTLRLLFLQSNWEI